MRIAPPPAASASLMFSVLPRLAHLDAVEGQRAGQHPVAGEGRTVGTSCLGDLAFVVGEDIIDAAAVDVERLAQILGGHGRASMPAGNPHPGAGPAQDMLRFSLLPQGEVGRVALCPRARRPAPFFQVLHDAAAQLAVFGKRGDAEVDRAVVHVACLLRSSA